MRQINNRKAYYNYNVVENFQAGIVLFSSQVKSIANGLIDITEGYITIDNSQVYLYNVNISSYSSASIFNHDRVRKRKLLLHKKEILKISLMQKNNKYTLIPLKIYEKNGKFKLMFGVCVPKKKYDKRQSIKQREQQKQIDRYIKQ